MLVAMQTPETAESGYDLAGALGGRVMASAQRWGPLRLILETI